jgi:hypothetical protein
MQNKSVWALVAVVAVVGALVGAQLWAQPRPQPRPGFAPYIPPQVGRFVLVKVDGKNIILLDTVTGDLYKATENDVKKYSDRPKVGVMPGPWGPPVFKDRFDKDKSDTRPGKDGDKDKVERKFEDKFDKKDGK